MLEIMLQLRSVTSQHTTQMFTHLYHRAQLDMYYEWHLICQAGVLLINFQEYIMFRQQEQIIQAEEFLLIDRGDLSSMPAIHC